MAKEKKKKNICVNLLHIKLKILKFQIGTLSIYFIVIIIIFTIIIIISIIFKCNVKINNSKRIKQYRFFILFYFKYHFKRKKRI